jgi:hypothetical protein
LSDLIISDRTTLSLRSLQQAKHIAVNARLVATKPNLARRCAMLAPLEISAPIRAPLILCHVMRSMVSVSIVPRAPLPPVWTNLHVELCHVNRVYSFTLPKMLIFVSVHSFATPQVLVLLAIFAPMRR